MRIKTLVFTVAFLSISFSFFAEAPELQYVMPNSWQNMTQLTQQEEIEFLLKNREILTKLDDETNLLYSNLDQTSVYKERYGKDIFYRLIISDEKITDHTNALKVTFVQVLVYEQNGTMVLLGAITYNNRGVDQRHEDWYAKFSAFIIVHDNDKAIGVMASSVTCYVDKDKNIGTSFLKKQLYGSTVMGYYFLLSDIRNIKETRTLQISRDMELYLCDKRLFSIKIFASDCLIDPKSPLKYGIQSAFDGDPSTSYVENTEDDLIKIDLTYAHYNEIKEMALINGYAQDRDLYENNNRIKSINAEHYVWNENHTGVEGMVFKEITLNDNTLIYQFFDIIAPSQINVLSIYRGKKYNDTCLAELNWKTNSGWLFGNMDE